MSKNASFIELLQASIQLYKKHWVVFCIMGAIAGFSDLMIDERNLFPKSVNIILTIVSAVIYLILGNVMIVLVSNIKREQSQSLASAWKTFTQKWIDIAYGYLLYFLFAMGPIVLVMGAAMGIDWISKTYNRPPILPIYVCFLIAGFFSIAWGLYSLRYQLFNVTILIENATANESLKRSEKLLVPDGRFYSLNTAKILHALVLSFFAGMLILAIPEMVLRFVNMGETLSQILGTVLYLMKFGMQFFLFPIFLIFMTTLYYSLRQEPTVD
jgi:hypothetical protein